MGFSDVQLGRLLAIDDLSVRKLRKDLGVGATYKLVDTCAAEFEAYTPYYYSDLRRPKTRASPPTARR